MLMLHQDRNSLELLGPRKKVRLHLCCKQYIRRVMFLNNQRSFNINVRRATRKYKHTQTAFEETFKKELQKHWF